MAVAEKRVKTLDEQFHEVSVAIAESHDFTGFCFTRLDEKIDRLAATMDRRFTRQELMLTELLNEIRARPGA